MKNSRANIFIIAIGIFGLLITLDTFAEESFLSGKLNSSKIDSKVNSNLLKTANKISSMAVTRGTDQSYGLISNPLIQVDDQGRIEVYLYCNEVNEANMSRLLDLGLIVENDNEELKIVQGWLPYENLEAAGNLGFIVKITPPSYAHTRVGSVTSEGDGVSGAADVRSMFGFDGTGIKIGVISDSVETIALSQATGDLPGSIEIGNPGDPVTGTNEGTAMLEIIHDLAPGAELAFHTAFPTTLDYLDAIEFFKSIGADIIVDDIGFLPEPYFQDGALAQAAQAAVDSGIVYISAAGNSALRHYQAFYLDDGGIVEDFDFHDFGTAAGGGTDIGLTYEIPGGGVAAFFLQWSDPFGASSNDYDLIVTDFFTGEIIALSEDEQNGNDDPLERVIIINSGFGSLLVDILVRKFSGTAQTLEINFNLSGGLTEYNVPEDSIFGHPAAPGVIATAAFDWLTPNTIESYSSHGPVSIISPSDASISTSTAISELRQKPDLAGPDGVTTTVPGFGTFFGTSAAAPHVAAIAALLLEALESTETGLAGVDPSITQRQVTEVRNALTSTAVDIGQPGFDTISGFGRINAVAAVQSVLAGGPTATPTATATPSVTPTPTVTQTSTPTPTTTTQPPGNDNNDDGGGGCSLQGPIATDMINSALLNVLVLFIPALVFGGSIIIKRRKHKKI